MRKNAFAVFAVLAALVLTSTASMAGGKWESQVTGGGDFGTFELAVSSRTAADGETKGMFQYTRDDLVFHGVVDCLYEGPSGVAMSGYVKAQEGFFADYVSVEVRNDGEAVRVRAVSSGATNCGYSGTYPGALVEGSFNIR